MPTGSRIRTDNVFGTVTDNPLTAGALTLNSAGLVNLAAVASNHAVIVLDPLRAAGAPEIVIVTAHTAAASSATITRGAYGTTARSHAAGVLWVHAPTTEDTIRIVTSGTRPSDPYKGQGIFETDTNKFVMYGGTDWAPRDAGGQLGYAQVVANQTAFGPALTDLTGLSVAVTVGTGRRIKVTGHVFILQNTSVGIPDGFFREGATTVGRLGSDDLGAGQRTVWDGSVILSPTAGAHTYKLSASTSAGTLTLFADAVGNHASILVEDIGAV